MSKALKRPCSGICELPFPPLSLQMLAKKLLACYTLWPGIVTQPSSFGLQVKAIEKLFLKQLNGASNRVGYVGSGNTVRSVWQVRMDTSIVTCFYPALCFSKDITWALDFHGGSVRVACLGLLQLANSSLVNIFKIESFPIYGLKNPHFRGGFQTPHWQRCLCRYPQWWSSDQGFHMLLL